MEEHVPKKDISGSGEGWQKTSQQQLVAASGAGQLLVIMRRDGEGHACGEVVFDCKNVLDCNE